MSSFRLASIPAGEGWTPEKRHERDRHLTHRVCPTCKVEKPLAKFIQKRTGVTTRRCCQCIAEARKRKNGGLCGYRNAR